MPINGGLNRVYVLGRECVLFIEGVQMTGISDLALRELVTEVDATGFNHQVTSTIVTQRSIEISFGCPDMAQARQLYDQRWRLFNGFKIPNVFEVFLDGGLLGPIVGKFTLHDTDADEPMNDIVAPRFTLKQWGHA
jgi:hypothetical protein